MVRTVQIPLVLAGGLRLVSDGNDPTSVLTGYLRLIRSLRNQRFAAEVPIRRDDIERLARFLELDGADVVERLASLMGATIEQRIAFRTMFAAGALMIGLVVGPTIALATASAPWSLHPAASSVGTIGSFDVAASLEGLVPAVRLQAPAPVAPEPSAHANRSGCNIDADGAVMRIAIPSISYDCPVYAGGQSLLDAGFVTLITDQGTNPLLATRPGQAGSLWLAGHRTTHGAAFAEVPDLADGTLIVVADAEMSATYRVVGRTYVQVRNGNVVNPGGSATTAATVASIVRSDAGGNLAPRLVLQTCDGANFRWMIYADLVTR